MSRLNHFVSVSFILIITACGGGSSPPPVSSANDDTLVTDEDSSAAIDVTANDSNMDRATVEVATPPRNGSVTLVGSGFLTYTPDENFSGTDTFTYSVSSNNNSGSGSATVTVIINDINDAPSAAADAALTLVNTPVVIGVLANDHDVDGSLDPGTLRVIADTINGTTGIDPTAGNVTFTPSAEYTGSDSFTYLVLDDDGDGSNEATVSISIVPIETTALTLLDLTVPTEDYVNEFNEEFNAVIPASAIQNFVLPPNSVSFALHLLGMSVADDPEQLFISDLTDPAAQSFSPLLERVEFCDTGFCSVLVPRQPSSVAIAGEWQFRLASLGRALRVVQVPELKLAVRTGPQPDLFADIVSEIEIRPFLTGTLIQAAEIEPVLVKAADLLLLNGIRAIFDPITVLTDPNYAEVSKDFNDADTADLVSNGHPAKVNLFYIESFREFGLLGITAGIPASLGVQSRFNGVLINASFNRVFSPATYARLTAETTVHEIGHYLGLSHTTESGFTNTDTLDDTPECVEEDDTNGDGFADTSECPDGSNIMFWESLHTTEKTDFTQDQQHVLHFSPLAITADE